MRRRIAFMAGSVALIAALTIPGGATAGGPRRSAADCVADLTVTITPGTRLTATRGTVKGGGPIRCTGLVFGTALNPSRVGRATVAGTYGPDTCANGTGRGSLTVAIAGKTASGAFTFARAGAAGEFNGALRDG